LVHVRWTAGNKDAAIAEGNCRSGDVDRWSQERYSALMRT
jgi:hypothetical protein